jgi:hypothetical protein
VVRHKKHPDGGVVVKLRLDGGRTFWKRYTYADYKAKIRREDKPSG